MDKTDYVLLINHDPLNVGGKFYDYVGGGKPILGAVHPEGESRRLFEECGQDGGRVLTTSMASASSSSTPWLAANRLSNEFHPDQEKNRAI